MKEKESKPFEVIAGVNKLPNDRPLDRLTCANDNNNNNGSNGNSSGQKQVRNAAVEGTWHARYPAEHVRITWLSKELI